MNLKSQITHYQSSSSSHIGYFAWDQDIKRARPGVLVIHEWWGLNDYVRMRADQLAEQGFAALAIDMYGNGLVAQNPEQATIAMNAVLENMESGTDRLKAGYSTLVKQPQVDDQKTAAIGYCFGGAMALHMARIGMPLRAVTSFHGALGSFHTPSPEEVKADVLVCHGGDDAMVSMDDVTSFKEEMDAANVNYQVIVHIGAPHGFTSREADENGKKYAIPVGYQAQADQASWAAMLEQFERVF